MGENILQQFHPEIQPLIKVVLTEKVGIGSGNIKISGISSGRPTDSAEGNADRFKLVIPYAGQKITWNVVFNSQKPHFAPDFCFDDDSFLADPDIEFLEEALPSLATWNVRDPRALLNVILELLEIYRKHQVELLEHADRSRMHFEYSSLICQAGVAEGDVEVLVGSGRQRSSSFLIRLQVDFSAIPQPLADLGEPTATLTVTFHSPTEGGRITPQLQLSLQAEAALEGVGGSGMSLPPFPPGGSCLMDYVPVVTARLQDRIDAAAAAHDRRRELITALFHHFGNGVLEYDGISFTRASFLLEWRDFYFILHFTLPPGFPREKPVVVFQSVYHATDGKPYRYRFEDFPYNPRTEVKKMTEKLIATVIEYVEVFQRNSIQSSLNL